jgi:hypothetical protein
MMARTSMKAAILLVFSGLSIEYRVPHGANLDGHHLHDCQESGRKLSRS